MGRYDKLVSLWTWRPQRCVVFLSTTMLRRPVFCAKCNALTFANMGTSLGTSVAGAPSVSDIACATIRLKSRGDGCDEQEEIAWEGRRAHWNFKGNSLTHGI